MKHQAHRSSRGRHTEPLYDVDVPTPTHAERARTLVSGVGTATLCTRQAEGYPYGSFVTFGLHGGAPVFLISELAEHTKNLHLDDRCSLLVAEHGEGDPLARGRVTLVGRCRPVEEAVDEVRAAYLDAHPRASYYIDFQDFALWHLEVESIRYIGGYGRMSWVEAPDFTAAEPDPLRTSLAGIVAHMNDDHAETMVLYCKAFTKAQTTKVQMVAVDRYGFEMSAETEGGPRPIRLPFAQEVSTALEVRQELVAMAKRARSALGVPG